MRNVKKGERKMDDVEPGFYIVHGVRSKVRRLHFYSAGEVKDVRRCQVWTT